MKEIFTRELSHKTNHTVGLILLFVCMLILSINIAIGVAHMGILESRTKLSRHNTAEKVTVQKKIVKQHDQKHDEDSGMSLPMRRQMNDLLFGDPNLGPF